MADKKLKQNSLSTTIKVDTKSVDNLIKRKNFITDIENNPELLNNLSNDRLIKLIKYYEKQIEEKQKILRKLQEESGNKN